jgi:hypothetical protein
MCNDPFHFAIKLTELYAKALVYVPLIILFPAFMVGFSCLSVVVSVNLSVFMSHNFFFLDMTISQTIEN